MASEQIVSRQRVADHGEVYTAEREVKAMCDLVKDETERIDARFLEPACGTGNFLVEILRRKLAVVGRKYAHSAYEWERYALLALGSLYGIDILSDNVAACRDILFAVWDAAYRVACGKECDDAVRGTARFMLTRNIILGNALTLQCVDAAQNDTAEPIVFSEWSFPRNDAILYRRDYSFAELLNAADVTATRHAEGYFGDLFANADGEVEPTLLVETFAHYKQLAKGDVHAD